MVCLYQGFGIVPNELAKKYHIELPKQEDKDKLYK